MLKEKNIILYMHNIYCDLFFYSFYLCFRSNFKPYVYVIPWILWSEAEEYHWGKGDDRVTPERQFQILISRSILTLVSLLKSWGDGIPGYIPDLLFIYIYVYTYIIYIVMCTRAMINSINIYYQRNKYIIYITEIE